MTHRLDRVIGECFYRLVTGENRGHNRKLRLRSQSRHGEKSSEKILSLLAKNNNPLSASVAPPTARWGSEAAGKRKKRRLAQSVLVCRQ